MWNSVRYSNPLLFLRGELKITAIYIDVYIYREREREKERERETERQREFYFNPNVTAAYFSVTIKSNKHKTVKL